MTDHTLDATTHFRPFQLADLEAVSRLDRIAFGDEAYPKTFLRQAYDLWPSLFIVGETSSGLIVGYGLGGLAQNCSTAWILALAVDTQSRSRGIGAGIVSKLLNSISEHGATEVRLTTRPDNLHALIIFKRLGFSVVDQDNAYFGQNEPRYVLVLDRLHPPSAT